MAKSPDYTGNLTIYTNDFKKIGEILMYESPDTNDKSPKFYGQIHLTETPDFKITGNEITANFGMWKQIDTGSKCPRCNAPKKPQYKLCYKCNLLQPTEAKQP